MLKKILLFTSLFFLGISKIFAVEISVENVFSDIDKNYKYLEELQTLYNRGVIFPGKDNKFNPKSLLSRAEFVGITSEVSCTKCIKPNTDLELFQKYTKKPFFDVEKENKYFYCIAEAKEKNFVKGYAPGDVCSDKTTKAGESPFCVNNNITLEEALAIIMRMSGLMTDLEAKKIISRIASGEKFPDLSTDVKPFVNGKYIYSFYPYFKKALEYNYTEYNNLGKKVSYKLLEKSNKLRPKQFITKEEFLKIAYITFKSSECREEETNLSVNILILDKECDSNNASCDIEKTDIKNLKISTLNDKENTYDFSENVGGVCEKGVESYNWKIYNFDSGKEIEKNTKSIDNFKFVENGKYRIYLRVVDKCGNIGEAYNTLNINGNINGNIDGNINGNIDGNIDGSIDGNNTNTGLKIISTPGLSLSITAYPIEGLGPLKVNFDAKISPYPGNYIYSWDFGDGNISSQKSPYNIYKNPGTYKIRLVVRDKKGNEVDSTTSIVVVKAVPDDLNIPDIDTDGDGIFDKDDICVSVYGVKKNNGCPVFEKSCNSDCSCENGYICSSNDIKVCGISGICKPIKEKENYGDCINSIKKDGYIYGNIICNSCPCSNFIDFNSDIRKCDILFPAITSPDQKQIYSKGDNFEIK